MIDRLVGLSENLVPAIRIRLSKHRLIAYFSCVAIVAATIWITVVALGSGTFYFWNWTSGSWEAIGSVGLLFGGVGVFLQIWENRSARRVEVGPYIRVDIGAPEVEQATEFHPPETYFKREGVKIDLDPEAEQQEKINVSAWFSNYQTHPLGFAATITARFFLQIYNPADDSLSFDVLPDIQIPYMEHCKPVEVELLSFPVTWTLRVQLAYLAYRDIYDKEHHTTVGLGDNSNVVHGRLVFLYSEALGPASMPTAYRKYSSFADIDLSPEFFSSISGTG